MSRQRRNKINKLKVAIVIFIIVLFLMTITGFGRFMYNSIRDRYLASKNFYFTSDLLTSNGVEYTYENWDGYGVYKIELDLFSKNNDLEKLEEDLGYELLLTLPEGLEGRCIFDEDELKVKEYEKNTITDTGKIEQVNNNTDRVIIYIKAAEPELAEGETVPDKLLTTGDTYTIEVTAFATEPYRKSISAKFNLKISDVSYDVDDEYYRDYAVLNVRNVSDYDSDVTIEFVTTNAQLDMNDEVVRDAISIEKNGKVVKSVTFKMLKESSKSIKVYKVNDDSKLYASDAHFKVSREISVSTP